MESLNSQLKIKNRLLGLIVSNPNTKTSRQESNLKSLKYEQQIVILQNMLDFCMRIKTREDIKMLNNMIEQYNSLEKGEWNNCKANYKKQQLPYLGQSLPLFSNFFTEKVMLWNPWWQPFFFLLPWIGLVGFEHLKRMKPMQVSTDSMVCSVLFYSAFTWRWTFIGSSTRLTWDYIWFIIIWSFVSCFTVDDSKLYPYWMGRVGSWLVA